MKHSETVFCSWTQTPTGSTWRVQPPISQWYSTYGPNGQVEGPPRPARRPFFSWTKMPTGSTRRAQPPISQWCSMDLKGKWKKLVKKCIIIRKNGLYWPRDPISQPRKVWVRPNFGLALLKLKILMITKSGGQVELIFIPYGFGQFFSRLPCFFRIVIRDT